jgi:hypothetical protein
LLLLCCYVVVVVVVVDVVVYPVATNPQGLNKPLVNPSNVVHCRPH